jgi:hypothetical protein
VGGRRHPWRLGPAAAVAAGGRHDRPRQAAGHSSWYLLTNLHRPASRRGQQANLAEVVRLYGPHNWVEQGYKQVKGELGWADFQVRSDRGDPSALDAGRLCVLVLLAGLPRRPARPTGPIRPAGRPDGRAGPRRAGIDAEPAARSSWPVAAAT